VCQGKAPCRNIIRPQIALKASLALLQGSSASRAARDLDLPAGLEALAAELDGFGQRYKRLTPQPLNVGEGLALALREAGRMLLRPGYEFADGLLRQELRSEYVLPDDSARQGLGALARAAGRLSLSVEAGDAGAVKRVMADAPGLRALGSAAENEKPAGLSQACRAASAVLRMASEIV
jgi:hypothetical protein